jgi:hypothetical protein
MRTAFILALATIVPVPFAIDQSRAADRLPAFDITRNCKTEGAGTGIGSAESCVKDENDAKDQLAKSWSGFSADAKKSCVGMAITGGDQSYVELLTCLEMSGGGHFSTKQ